MRDINPELRARAEGLGIKILGTWGETKIQETIDALTNTTPDVDKFHTLEWANERAAKIWEGQSPNLGIAERVGRIRSALKVRGFTRFEELEIPTTENYKIYL